MTTGVTKEVEDAIDSYRLALSLLTHREDEARAALLAAIQKYGDERVREYQNRPYDPKEHFNYDC